MHRKFCAQVEVMYCGGTFTTEHRLVSFHPSICCSDQPLFSRTPLVHLSLIPSPLQEEECDSDITVLFFAHMCKYSFKFNDEKVRRFFFPKSMCIFNSFNGCQLTSREYILKDTSFFTTLPKQSVIRSVDLCQNQNET